MKTLKIIIKVIDPVEQVYVFRLLCNHTFAWKPSGTCFEILAAEEYAKDLIKRLEEVRETSKHSYKYTITTSVHYDPFPGAVVL